MSRKLVLFGMSKQAQLADFYFTNDSEYEVAAFTVDRDYADADEYLGRPLVPFDEVQERFPPSEYDMFVAVGYKGLNGIRADAYARAKAKGYTLATYLSSKAIHWGDTVIGDNCFILENQVIQPFVQVGNNVVLWSGNHFGHDVVIADHVWISSHTVLSGGVHVGERTFIGVNATVRDQVRIGRECIIGAGVVMLRDAADKEVNIAKPTDPYPLDSERFERMMQMSR